MQEGVGKLVVIPSVWGHWAGGPGDNPEDVKFIDEQLKALGLGGSSEDVKLIDEQVKALEL